jgi:hypothetical protein
MSKPFRGHSTFLRKTKPVLALLLVAFEFLVPAPSAPAAAWSARIEEPTGLYPRTNEVVAVPYAKLGGKHDAWQVVDPQGREVPWQATDSALLFPATLIPGELPEFQITTVSETNTNFVNQIRLRKLGLNRIELGNRFFRVLVDLRAAAIVEAFNLSADDHRILNLVETTPEERDALKEDIHAAEAMGVKPVPGVPEGNVGWTTVGGSGSITKVEFVETGPLRGRLRLGRLNETWELTWSSESRAFLWSASKGFRFTAISASPYLPFDRCVGGSEYEWPNGPDDEEPPDHDITPRQWSRLPGNLAVYYHHAENYGALGVVALDTNLVWTGIGSRRFIAQRPEGASEIAVTFPQWLGSNTVLQARREYRVLRQPLIIEVIKGSSDPVPVRHAAERMPVIESETNGAAMAPFRPNALSLDGPWELAWCEKGAGPPAQGWRTVKVPGSAHIQWLDPSKIYSRDAEWISSKEWWYRRNFNVPENTPDKRLLLQFGATDYYADTWLNGTRLGRHEGYIDPYEYDVTSQIHLDAANELLVRTWAPVNYYWKHRSYTIKGAYGAVDQKPDDITPLGITRPVRLAACDTLKI